MAELILSINQEKTPLQLGNIESLTDIPIPSVRKSKQNQEENGEKSETKMPKNMDELGKTILPASFFEQNSFSQWDKKR